MGTLRKLLSVVASVITCIAIAVPAYADPAAPDNPPDFEYFYVNRNVLETGDMVFYAEYHLNYAAWAGMDAANVNYLFKLIAVDGVTQLGVALPYPYNNLGYNAGVVSFYFTAAQVVTLGLTFTGTPGYLFRLCGNPAKWGTLPAPYSEAIPSSSYSTYTTTEDNQHQMAARIEVLAGLLETAWTLTLLESQDPGIVLAAAGEDYFRNAIPGCQGMAGDIFFVQSVAADTSTRVWGNSLDATYKTRLDGTFIKTGLQGLADWINVPLVLIFGVITLAACIFLIKKSQDWWGTPIAGYVGSLIVIIGMGVIVMGFALIGLVALALALAGGWFLFMRKA